MSRLGSSILKHVDRLGNRQPPVAAPSQKSEEAAAMSRDQPSVGDGARAMRAVGGLLGGLTRRKDPGTGSSLEAALEENRPLHSQLQGIENDFRQQTAVLQEELQNVYAEREALIVERDHLALQSSKSSRCVSGSSLAPSPASARRSSTSPCQQACVADPGELQRLKAETIVLSRALAISRGESTPDSVVTGDRNAAEASLGTLLSQRLETALLHLKDSVEGGTADSSAGLPLTWKQAQLALLDGLLQDLLQVVSPQHCERDAPQLSAEPIESFELAVVVEERNLLQKEVKELSAQWHRDCMVADETSAKLRDKEKFHQDVLTKVNAEKQLISQKYRESSSGAKKLRGECDGLRSELQYMQSRLQTRNEGAAQVVESLRDEIKCLEAKLAQSQHRPSPVDLAEAATSSGNRQQCEKIEHLERKIIVLREECRALHATVADAEQISARRKALADELAIEKQELMSRLVTLDAEHMSILEKKDSKIVALQMDLSELAELKVVAATFGNLQNELAASSAQHAMLEERMNCQKKEFAAELLEKESDIATVQSNAAELAVKLEVAEQEVSDAAAKVLIVEKKAAASLKDMKHQLSLESKRVDRLQQVLQSFLAEQEEEGSMSDGATPEDGQSNLHLVDVLKRMTSLSTGMLDEIVSSLGGVLTSDVPFRLRNASVSSPAPCPAPDSNPASPCAPARKPLAVIPGRTGSDKDALLYKSFSQLEAMVHGLRSEKEVLEDRVHLLEQNAACMADELIEKSAIIRTCVSPNSEQQRSRTASRSQVGKRASAMSLVSFLSPATPGELLRRFKNDSGHQPISEEGSEVVQLQRRVEEGMVKVTHLQQTLANLVSENELLRLQRTRTHRADSVGGKLQSER